MGIVIGVLIAIVVIGIYIQGLLAVANLWMFVVGMIVVSITFLFICSSLDKSNLTFEQLQEIKKAKEQDEKNKKDNAERGKREARAEATKLIEKKQKELEPLLAESRELYAQIKELENKMAARQVLHRDQMDIKIIDDLLDYLEHNKARDIPDAFSRIEARSHRLLEDLKIRLREQEETRRRNEAMMQQIFHQARMEDQARRQADEMERIRRNLENN